MLCKVYKYRIKCDGEYGACKEERTYETTKKKSVPDDWESHCYPGEDAEHFCPACKAKRATQS